MSTLSLHSSPFTPDHSFTDGIEGPACDADGNLYVVNYARQGTIGKVTAQGGSSVFVELPAGSIGNGIRFNRQGEMLIADYTKHNVLRVDMHSRAIDIYAHEPSMNQPNDLAIAANNILFCSDPNWKEGTGKLWRVGLDRKAVLLEAGMGTTNGIEVSPDERTLYVNETVQRNIWAYDLSADGEISNKRLLIQFPDYSMDGMRCDIAGNLYVTRYGKGVVAIVSPTGGLLHEIELGGARCSNLAFGGDDGRTLYITIVDHGRVESVRSEIPGREWQLGKRK